MLSFFIYLFIFGLLEMICLLNLQTYVLFWHKQKTVSLLRALSSAESGQCALEQKVPITSWKPTGGTAVVSGMSTLCFISNPLNFIFFCLSHDICLNISSGASTCLFFFFFF